MSKHCEGEVVNISDFVAQLSKKYGYPKSHAKILMDDVLNLILDNIEAGNELSFYGIGRLEIRRRKGYKAFTNFTGRDTRGYTEIPDRFGFKFVPGNKLIVALNKWAAGREHTEVGG